jgi:hypothetical protein
MAADPVEAVPTTRTAATAATRIRLVMISPLRRKPEVGRLRRLPMSIRPFCLI